jgi:hypothetical protein
MEIKLMRNTITALITAASIFVPIHASAQGVSGGAERGAPEGDRAAGPVGAIVGGTVGGVVGGVASLLGADERPREYRYTVVNDRTVLVDPRTDRIVEVVE